MATFENWWQLKATIGNFCELFGNIWQLLATFGNFWQHWQQFAIYGYLWQHLASVTFFLSFSLCFLFSCWHSCPLWAWQVISLAICASCLLSFDNSITLLFIFSVILVFYFFPPSCSLFFSFSFLILLSFLYRHFHLSLHLSHLCFCGLLSITCDTCVSIFIGLWQLLFLLDLYCIFIVTVLYVFSYFDISWWRLSICFWHQV